VIRVWGGGFVQIVSLASGNRAYIGVTSIAAQVERLKEKENYARRGFTWPPLTPKIKGGALGWN
jgi:hypothetical protein